MLYSHNLNSTNYLAQTTFMHVRPTNVVGKEHSLNSEFIIMSTNAPPREIPESAIDIPGILPIMNFLH